MSRHQFYKTAKNIDGGKLFNFSFQIASNKMNKKILTITLITLVLVSGGFYFWNNKYDQKIVNQEQEEIINNGVDISDWETFRDEELGIEFKYPGDWEIRRSETSYGVNKAGQIYFYTTTTLNNPSEGNKVTKIVLEAFDNIYDKTPAEVIIIKTGLSSGVLEEVFLGEVILDGQKVSKYTIPGFVSLPGLIFEHEDKVYQMTYNLNENHFNKVLETFKFIE